MIKFVRHIKFKTKKTKPNLWFFSFIIFGIITALSYNNLFGCNKVFALVPTDYCYKYDLSAQNSGTTKEFYPVLLEGVNQNSWVNDFGYIDEFGWSIYGYKASLSEEKEIMLQDMDSLVANQWYIFPELSFGKNSLNVLLGSEKIQRDQGMFFGGSDYTMTLHDSDFNTTDFNIWFQFEDLNDDNCNPSCIDQVIIEKYDSSASDGFMIYLEHNPSNYSEVSIVVTIDALFGQSAYFTPSGNESVQITLTGGDLDITTSAGTDSFVGLTYSNNSHDIYIGVNETLSGKQNYLDDVVIRNISGEFGGTCNPDCSPVFYYGYNPSDITQTSGVDPEYSGIVLDISGSTTTHNSNYFFDRSQAGITVLASTITSSTASGSTIFTPQTTDLIGRWWGSGNPNTLADGNANFLGLNFLDVGFFPSGNLKVPQQLWYSMWASAFGFLLSIGVFWIFRNIPMSLFASSVPILLFQIQGLIEPWYTVVYFLVLGSIYSTSLWVERS